MMNSIFTKSHVYATYSFGRYRVRLWEELQPDYRMRVGVVVGYVLETADGELIQVKVTGKFEPNPNSIWPMEERLAEAYATNERYFSNAVRVADSVLDVMMREHWSYY